MSGEIKEADAIVEVFVLTGGNVMIGTCTGTRRRRQRKTLMPWNGQDNDGVAVACADAIYKLPDMFTRSTKVAWCQVARTADSHSSNRTLA